MDSEWRALDRIERAMQLTPFCSCGQPSLPVAGADGIWLECSSSQAPARSRMGRLLAQVTARPHLRRQLVEWMSEAA